MDAVLSLFAKCYLGGASGIFHQGQIMADCAGQQRLIAVCPCVPSAQNTGEGGGKGWGGLPSLQTWEEMAQGYDGETSPPYIPKSQEVALPGVLRVSLVEGGALHVDFRAAS